MALLTPISKSHPTTPTELYTDAIKQLKEANDLFSSAIDKYLQACGDIAYCFESGGTAAQMLLIGVKNELLKLPSYDQRYQRAKVSLHRIRNRCPKIVPINSLPSEVMSRIFCSINYCCISTNFVNLSDSRTTTTTPETYLEVCSRWRQVAMESSRLWTPIDLTPSDRHNARSFERARAFAIQAGRAPLSFHISAGSDGRKSSRANKLLVDFCVSLTPRIQSLDFLCSESTQSIQHVFTRPLLSTVIQGVVTRFSINTRAVRFHSTSFLVPDRSNSSPTIAPALELKNVDESMLEDFLCPINRLRLDSTYFYWTSKAYHGLVELQLVGRQDGKVTIPDHQLAGILKASPGLQIFHYGLEIQPAREADAPDPVKLDHLEVFRLDSLSSSMQAAVMGMIRPGHKLRQVAVKLREHITPKSAHHIRLATLLDGSNRVQLYLEGTGSHFEPFELLQRVPQLDSLVLSDFMLGVKYKTLPDTMPCSRIDILHMIECRVNWNGFQRLIEVHSVQKLATYRGMIISGTRVDSDVYYRDVLREICHSVEFPKDNQHFLVEDW